MKLTTAALVAVFAATAHGFSVSMSSIGYLDKLSSGSVSLSSFGSGYTPAPAPASQMPYGAPAPAPAPAQSSYRSIFADVPENKDLHYLKTLGGGASMKNGRNFSGVSSSFRTTKSGSLYLDALPGKQMATSDYTASPPQGYGAPAPSYSAPSSSYAPAPASYGAPAPAPANGSYLSNLGSASSSSYGKSDYSGVNPRPSKTRSAFGSYLENL